MRRVGVLLIGLLTAGLVGYAQAARAAEFSLFPTAEIDEIYDDNTRNTPTNAKGDFITAESLGATLDAEAPRRSFFLTYTTLMTENASYSNQDSFGKNHNVALSDTEHWSKDTNLAITDDFLMGNAIGGFLLVNSSAPITSQLISSLLYHNSSLSNSFVATVTSKYSDRFTWSANAHQVFYSTLSNSSAVAAPFGSPSSGDSFDQGGALTGDYLVGERFTAGAGFTFDDFRFSNGDVPTTDAYWPQARAGWGVGTPFSVTASLGPIIASSSSGKVGAVAQSAQTKVDPGYLVAGSYKTRRLLLSASAGQIPNTSAGLGGFSTSQSYSALFQYKLTRHILTFANFGFLSFSGTGVSSNFVTYTVGISYRLTEMLTVNAQYLGYQEIGGSAGPTSVSGLAVGNTVTNLYEIGLIITPLPYRWRY